MYAYKYGNVSPAIYFLTTSKQPHQEGILYTEVRVVLMNN